MSVAATNEKHATAELLAHIAEFDERKLYLQEAYPSMFAYCGGELMLSDDAAAKRIQVARVARQCPAVFDALAQGRVHLSGLVLLIKRVERVRFGACTKPHVGRRRGSANPRYVPAEVRRAVWQRDGGQCTFVSESGRRCEARGEVEFDNAKEGVRLAPSSENEGAGATAPA